MKKELAFAALFAASSAVFADTSDDMRLASNGKCLEDIVAEMIKEQGVDKAGELVTIALTLSQIAEISQQQKALGCAGNIGESAIAAGADPTAVLAATAAGLGAPSAGAPANLGGLNGGLGTGIIASPS